MGNHSLPSRRLARLEREIRATHEARHFKRALALIEVAKGEPVSRVAEKMQVTRAAVHNWIKAYKTTGSVEALHDHARPGRPSVWTDNAADSLKYAMESDPEDFGYMAVGWTVDLLQKHLTRVTGATLSADTIRRRLHSMGYVWKYYSGKCA